MNITLHLTNRCNLACKYCYVDKEYPSDMTLNVAKQAIDMGVMSSKDQVGISFFGGEPLLKKELIKEIVSYCEEISSAKNIKFKFNLTTNGILLDAAFAIYAKEKKISMAISHDGIKEAHNINRMDRAGNGSFDKVDSNSTMLLKHHPYASVILVITPNTVTHLYKSILYLFNKGFRYLLVSFDYGAKWDEKSMELLESQYKRLSTLYYQKSMANHKFYLEPFETKIASYIDNQSFNACRCTLGKGQISIAPDGSIYPCTQLINDPLLLMGNAHTGITKDISYLKDKGPKEETCNQCVIKNRCTYDCSCINKQTTGDINKVSPVLCIHEQMIIMIADKLANQLYKAKNEAFINKHYNNLYSFISVFEDRAKEGRFRIY